MFSTVRNPPQTMMFASPSPVEPAAPTVLSVYCPAPTMAESPTLPGTFQERPLVVTIDEERTTGVGRTEDARDHVAGSAS
jgi:hypothetical protein